MKGETRSLDNGSCRVSMGLRAIGLGQENRKEKNMDNDMGTGVMHSGLQG